MSENNINKRISKTEKKWFKLALVQRELTNATFAGGLTAKKVSSQYVSRVLSGYPAPWMEAAIREFTKDTLPLIHKRLEDLRDNRHPIYC